MKDKDSEMGCYCYDCKANVIHIINKNTRKKSMYAKSV
jgi:hypothetical protein